MDVIAYKFLASGAIGPFTGFAWPVPTAGDPGPWVIAASPEKHRWIHAARVEDLPYWLGEELWAIELDGAVEALPTQIVAPRGRLVDRVSGWTEATSRAFGAAVAWRVRELAVQVFEAHGLGAAADRLRAAAALADVRPAVIDACSGSAGVPGTAARVAEYAADAAAKAAMGSIAAALYCAANAAVIASGSPESYDAERRWQAAWLAERLGLCERPSGGLSTWP